MPATWRAIGVERYSSSALKGLGFGAVCVCCGTLFAVVVVILFFSRPDAQLAWVCVGVPPYELHIRREVRGQVHRARGEAEGGDVLPTVRVHRLVSFDESF